MINSKTFETTVILMLLSLYVYSQDLSGPKLNVKGKVKSITEVSYDAYENDGQIRKGESVRSDFESSYKFDIKNNIIEENLIDVNGTHFKNTYKYDQYNNVIEQKQYDANLKLTYAYTVVIKYDSNGNIIEFQRYGQSDNDNWFARLKINERGKWVELFMHFPSNIKRDWKEVRIYDELGNNVAQHYYDGVGNYNWSFFYNYDESGFLFEEKSKGLAMNNYLKRYDKKGNNIELVLYKEDGSIAGKTIMEYDKRSNIVMEVFFDERGSNEITEYRYLYDYNGNWTRKTTICDGDPMSIIERKIEYYSE